MAGGGSSGAGGEEDIFSTKSKTGGAFITTPIISIPSSSGGGGSSGAGPTEIKSSIVWNMPSVGIPLEKKVQPTTQTTTETKIELPQTTTETKKFTQEDIKKAVETSTTERWNVSGSLTIPPKEKEISREYAGGDTWRVKVQTEKGVEERTIYEPREKGWIEKGIIDITETFTVKEPKTPQEYFMGGLTSSILAPITVTGGLISFGSELRNIKSPVSKIGFIGETAIGYGAGLYRFAREKPIEFGISLGGSIIGGVALKETFKNIKDVVKPPEPIKTDMGTIIKTKGTAQPDVIYGESFQTKFKTPSQKAIGTADFKFLSKDMGKGLAYEKTAGAINILKKTKWGANVYKKVELKFGRVGQIQDIGGDVGAVKGLSVSGESGIVDVGLVKKIAENEDLAGFKGIDLGVDIKTKGKFLTRSEGIVSKPTIPSGGITGGFVVDIIKPSGNIGKTVSSTLSETYATGLSMATKGSTFGKIPPININLPKGIGKTETKTEARMTTITATKPIELEKTIQIGKIDILQSSKQKDVFKSVHINLPKEKQTTININKVITRVSEKQKQIDITKQITSQITLQKQKTIIGKPFVPPFIPPTPTTGGMVLTSFGGRGRTRSIFGGYRRKIAYRPSISGLYLKKFAKKPVSRIVSGFGIRPMLRRGKRRKRLF